MLTAIDYPCTVIEFMVCSIELFCIFCQVLKNFESQLFTHTWNTLYHKMVAKEIRFSNDVFHNQLSPIDTFADHSEAITRPPSIAVMEVDRSLVNF